MPPPVDGIAQTITVTVPPVAIVELDEQGMPAAATTNTGRPPAPGDEIHVRLGDRYVPADAGLTALVLAAPWRPGTCDPGGWTV